jgi:polysaccharide transporter, PST family
MSEGAAHVHRHTLDARRGLIWSALSSWTNNGLSLVLVTLLARLIAPSEFGLLAMAMIFVSLGQIIVSDTASAALVQCQKLEDAHLDTAFWAMAVVGLAVTLAELAAAGPIARLFGESAVRPLLQVLSIRLIFDALMTVPMALLLRKLDFRALALRSALANLGGGSAGIVIATMGGGVWALVVQQLVNGFLTLAVYTWSAGWRPRLTLSWRHARALLAFSGHTVVIRASAFASGNSDRLLLGNLMGPMTLGYYVFARRIYDMSAQSLTSVVNAVSFPLFAAKAESDQLRAAVERTASLAAMGLIPAFTGLAVIADDLIPLLFGERWAPAAPVVSIFALMGITGILWATHESALKSAGRAGWWSAISIASALLNVVGYVIAAPYGLIPVAIASLAAAVLLLPLHTIMVLRALRLSAAAYLGSFVVPVVASIIMAASLLVLRDAGGLAELPSLERVVLEVAAAIAVYGVAALALAPMRTLALLSDLLPAGINLSRVVRSFGR